MYEKIPLIPTLDEKKFQKSSRVGFGATTLDAKFTEANSTADQLKSDALTQAETTSSNSSTISPRRTRPQQKPQNLYRNYEQPSHNDDDTATAVPCALTSHSHFPQTVLPSQQLHYIIFSPHVPLISRSIQQNK